MTTTKTQSLGGPRALEALSKCKIEVLEHLCSFNFLPIEKMFLPKLFLLGEAQCITLK
jgi:hypothetical protein